MLLLPLHKKSLAYFPLKELKNLVRDYSLNFISNMCPLCVNLLSNHIFLDRKYRYKIIENNRRLLNMISYFLGGISGPPSPSFSHFSHQS